MKRWQLAVLIFELVLFAAILVLPQVALPAFAFHSGTAPVVAHSRVCEHTPATAITVPPHVIAPSGPAPVQGDRLNLSALRSVHSNLSKLCVLIC